MDLPLRGLTCSERRDELCDIVAALVPEMQARAATLDERSGFPSEDFIALREAGCLRAPLPTALGGLGLGTEPAGAVTLSKILRAIGRGNLSVGRLYEAHVNAVRLIACHGTPAHLHRAAEDVSAGHLIGLWVTDQPDDPLRASPDGSLLGAKSFCSGAGFAKRAVVTATDAGGVTRLAYLAVDTAEVTPLAGRLQGMRAAVTGRVSFEAGRIAMSDWIGGAEDYMSEPDFSAGAWRTSAVTCGGLEALVELAMGQLASRRRGDDPHQRARMGRVWICRETALMWLARAASAAEGCERGMSAADIVATVNFGRIAIEAACLEASTLVAQSIGLSSFLQSNPIERIGRDLATYLRQPAGDEILTDAAAHAMAHWVPQA